MDLWDNIKHANICLVAFLEGKERDKGTSTVFEEIMSENFLNLAKGTDIKIQEAYRVPNKMNPQRPTPKLIIIKMSKFKD